MSLFYKVTETHSLEVTYYYQYPFDKNDQINYTMYKHYLGLTLCTLGSKKFGGLKFKSQLNFF